MPKKTRKAKIRAAQRPIRVGYPVGTAAPASETVRDQLATRTVAPSLASSRLVAPLMVDYSYVYRDLRRIAILAGTFFVLMFVIWFLVEVQGIHLIPGLL